MKKIIVFVLLVICMSSCDEHKTDTIIIEVVYTDGRFESIEFEADLWRTAGTDKWKTYYDYLDNNGCIHGFARLRVCDVKKYTLIY